MVMFLLLIESTSAIGVSAMSRQSVAELHIEAVGQADRNTLPYQYRYYNARCLTRVPRALSDQHQELLIHTGPPYYLDVTYVHILVTHVYKRMVSLKINTGF